MRIELDKAEKSILSSLFITLSQELGIIKEDVKYYFFQSLVDRDDGLYDELLSSINHRILKASK